MRNVKTQFEKNYFDETRFTSPKQLVAALLALAPKQLLNMAAVLGAVAVRDKMDPNSEVYNTSLQQARLGLHNGEMAHTLYQVLINQNWNS